MHEVREGAFGYWRFPLSKNVSIEHGQEKIMDA